MPRLSDTMEEGTVIKWHKSVGDTISEGDLLAEIETDKAIQEFESEYNGYLLYIGVPNGKRVKVDTLLAIIAENPNEDINNLLYIHNNSVNKDISNITPNGSKERLLISPLAKMMAKNKSFSLENIKGSGINGRIVKRDIENYQMKINNRINSSNKEKILNTSTILTSKEVINSSFRKVIAKRLTESKFTAPHYYLMIEIDMKESIKSRIILNNNLKKEEKISFNDLIIKAAALSLKKNMNINSSWINDKIIYHSNINIGVAIATEEGLFVPVITEADNKKLLQISLEIKEKIKSARTRKISKKEIEGSTFTISNLGMFGIEIFTSIINQPNSCILSVGAILEKPVIKNGIVVRGNIMKISLACDHRIIDGSIGSFFLRDIKNFLENPITFLL